jgi:hypothetical protein
MEISEGYNYRINIVSADSSVLVDSYNGIIQGSVKGIDGSTIVDAFNNTVYGTFFGNIVDHNNELMFNYVEKTISIDKLTSQTVISRLIIGDLYNDKNEIVFNNHESSITNINFIKSKNISTDEIKSNVFQGSVFSKDNSLIIDASTKTIYGSLLGNIVDHNYDLIFDLDKNTIKIEQLNSKLVNAEIVKLGTHNNQNDIKAQKGMIIFNDSIGKFQGYTGTEWVNLH